MLIKKRTFVGLVMVCVVSGCCLVCSFQLRGAAVFENETTIEKEDLIEGGSEEDDRQGSTADGMDEPGMGAEVVPENADGVDRPEVVPEKTEPIVIAHPLPAEPLMATPHFEWREYACDCEGYCDGWPAQMDSVLLEKIEALRCALGTPVVITSGVRCARRNVAVGGISGSYHLSGHAADLYAPGRSVDAVAEVARALELGVLVYYDQGFLHCEIWI